LGVSAAGEDAVDVVIVVVGVVVVVVGGGKYPLSYIYIYIIHLRCVDT
jgi:hypothetical protein